MVHLLQISEPESSANSNSKNSEIAIGIDFGTTNSVVAIANNGKSQVVGDQIIPSVVGYDDNGMAIIGSKALDLNTKYTGGQ